MPRYGMLFPDSSEDTMLLSLQIKSCRSVLKTPHLDPTKAISASSAVNGGMQHSTSVGEYIKWYDKQYIFGDNRLKDLDRQY